MLTQRPLTRTVSTALVMLLCATALSACSSDKKDEEIAADAAAAVDAVAAEQAAVEKKLAEQKAKREAEEKARAEAEAAKSAAIDALIVAPDPIPKRAKLNKACGKVSAAYDGFMNRLYEGPALEKWNGGGKEMQLGMINKNCMQHNVAVALCQAHALENATEELKKEVPEFLKRCIDKYGKNEM